LAPCSVFGPVQHPCGPVAAVGGRSGRQGGDPHGARARTLAPCSFFGNPVRRTAVYVYDTERWIHASAARGARTTSTQQ
jgi:hypothetical protein